MSKASLLLKLRMVLRSSSSSCVDSDEQKEVGMPLRDLVDALTSVRYLYGAACKKVPTQFEYGAPNESCPHC